MRFACEYIIKAVVTVRRVCRNHYDLYDIQQGPVTTLINDLSDFLATGAHS